MSLPKSELENRLFTRHKVRSRLKFSFIDEEPEGSPLDCYESITEDISLGGLRFITSSRVPVGHRIRFSLLNKQDNNWSPYTQGMVSRTSYLASSPNTTEVGISFFPDIGAFSNHPVDMLTNAEIDIKKDSPIDSAYDGTTVTYKLLRIFGWGPLNNLGFFRFPAPLDILNIPSAFIRGKLRNILPEAQSRLIMNSMRLLKVAPGEKLLDIACGKGFSSFIAANNFPNSAVVGIDLLSRNINAAKALYGGVHNLRFIKDDALNINMKNNSVDKLMCVEAAFHFPDRQQFMNEVFRLLKPGGKAVIVDFMWKSGMDRVKPTDAVANLVKSEWKWNDFSSHDEYLDMARKSGFNSIRSIDWSRWVTGPLEITFLLVAFLGSFSIGRHILRFINPSTKSLSISEWGDVMASAKAHEHLRKKTKYIALILVKDREPKNI